MVAAQRFGTGARRLNQVFDDGGGNVVAVESGFERGAVSARARLEPIPVADGVVQRRIGVEAGLVSLVERLERGGAVGLLAPRGEDRAILSVRHGDRFAVRQRDHRELGVGRRQCPVGVVGRGRQTAGERHQPLPLFVEHVFLLAIEILDGEPVQLQGRSRIDPGTDRVERYLQQFRIEPGLRLLPLREENLHLLAARVDRVVALVFVVFQ